MLRLNIKDYAVGWRSTFMDCYWRWNSPLSSKRLAHGNRRFPRLPPPPLLLHWADHVNRNFSDLTTQSSSQRALLSQILFSWSFRDRFSRCWSVSQLPSISCCSGSPWTAPVQSLCKVFLYRVQVIAAAWIEEPKSIFTYIKHCKSPWFTLF